MKREGKEYDKSKEGKARNQKEKSLRRKFLYSIDVPHTMPQHYGYHQ